ncbi:serine/threonine-protein kinase [Sorangium sp. So ce176]|uniref:serine/threonine-protein kinase n=1 Tax=Sorangium sp. So ce176 TaxID=3133286 RepID=UPI003F6484F2
MSLPLDPSEVEALFEAAIDRPTHDDRRAFLEARCAGRPELFREVWSLLRCDGAQPDGFLNGAAVALRARDEALSPGARVGRFTVLDRAGQGGMGIVYAAYDPELDRRVALKLIAPGTFDPEGRSRLVREAQAMARLSHPNVVPIYEIGEHGRGVFVAMEFVDGRTLRDLSREPPRAWEAVLAAGIEAGRGLAAAHREGLVHRDVKPDNILIGKDGRARIADFGLARPQHEADWLLAGGRSAGVPGSGSLRGGGSLHAPLTAGSAFMGTPAYMAPEQAERVPATSRSDQWSFCATLYEALYGELPFEGEDLHARLDRARRDLLRLATPGSKVPLWVRDALARGLRARPEERWPTLDDLLDFLAEQLAKSSDIDLTVSRRERIRFGLAIGAVGVVMATVGVGRFVPVVHPAHLLGMGCLTALLGLSLLRAFRRPLSRNAVNRRIVHVVKMMFGAMLLHRALAVITDEPVERALATNLLLFAAIHATAAPGLRKASWLSAAICAACAAAAAVFPEHARALYAAGVLGSLANAIVAWHLD